MEDNHFVYPIERYMVGLPIKVFEYMACSLPMVMFNFSYWQEIFSECALFVNPYDASLLKNLIETSLRKKH